MSWGKEGKIEKVENKPISYKLVYAISHLGDKATRDQIQDFVDENFKESVDKGKILSTLLSYSNWFEKIVAINGDVWWKVRKM